MSEQTLKQMTDDWTVKMAARYDVGHPRAGQRIAECDPKYAREVTALGVQIAELKAAEVAQPQINQEQLAWLNRAQGATDKDGKRLTENPVYAKNLREAREKVYSGGDISGMTLGGGEGVKLGPEFAEVTSKQHQVGHEAGLTFGPHHSVRGGVGAIVTNTTPGTA